MFGAGLWALGPDLFVWGFAAGTVALWHAAFSTGSFSHRVGGYRSFETGDDSRNSLLIAMLLLGEGWHNNHHHAPRAARHGIGPREPDLIYIALRLLERMHLVSDLQPG